MTIAARLTALMLAAFAAPLALGQGQEDSVRLRLALDSNGRLHLSTEPVSYAPPPLLQPSLPLLSGWNEARVPTATSVGIDLTTRQSDPSSLAPCFAAGGLSQMGAFGGCETIGYNGLPGVVHSGDFVLRFDAGQSYGLNLSYGLDWLEAAPDSTLPGQWLRMGELSDAAASILLPGWVGPVLNHAGWRSERLGIGGFLWLAPDLKLNLNYEHAQGPMALFQIESGILPWESGNQDSVSLGLDYGRFHGALVGRQLRPDNPLHGGAMDSLDLGFSWRMPWNAAVEFGARNLIVRPRKPDPDAPAIEESDLRVPYLRYHQEL